MATIGSKEMKYFAKLLVTNLIIVFLVLLLLIFSLFDYNEICVYFLLSTCMPIVLYMYAYCSVHVCLLFCTCMPIVLYMYAYCSVHVCLLFCTCNTEYACCSHYRRCNRILFDKKQKDPPKKLPKVKTKRYIFEITIA